MQYKTRKVADYPLVRRLRSAPVLIVIACFGVGVLAAPLVRADASCNSTADCQQQIDTLNQQNSQAQQSVSDLEAKAGSYQNAINALQSQIGSLQSQIDANEAQQADLQQKIVAAQAELDKQKQILGSDIKALYVGGQISTVEQLATSKSLSDFVDAQTYRNAVQSKIQDTLAQVAKLQGQLKDQKTQVDLLLQTQQTQQTQQAAEQSQQDQLLAFNEDQQTQFNQQIQTNKSALSQLYAQQAKIIAASFGGGFHYGGTGGYPYADAGCLNSNGDCGPDGGLPYGPYAWGYPPSNQYDGAGWAYRNCTGYAFWRLAQTTGVTLTASLFPNVYASGGRIGHSIPDFQNLGYTVDKDPSGTAVLAVNTGGNFGHIMYVEGVVNGQAVVSQYNAAEDGLYSTGTLTNLNGISFIHIR